MHFLASDYHTHNLLPMIIIPQRSVLSKNKRCWLLPGRFSQVIDGALEKVKSRTELPRLVTHQLRHILLRSGARVWTHAFGLMWVAQRYGVEGLSVIFQSTQALWTMQQTTLFSSSAYGSGTSVKYFQRESQLFPGGLERWMCSLKGQLKTRTGTKGEVRWRGQARGRKLIFCGSKPWAGREDRLANWHHLKRQLQGKNSGLGNMVPVLVWQSWCSAVIESLGLRV